MAATECSKGLLMKSQANNTNKRIPPHSRNKLSSRYAGMAVDEVESALACLSRHGIPRTSLQRTGH